ncbi:N-acetylmuramidase domain-containing protein [Erythrobacter sp. NE805]|uniref:N-acetylmuramidase domain-containing protein n=1 Tax=Erythrobacter sp. NE805 TaxID=3389875 RepID=UPI00396B3C13
MSKANREALQRFLVSKGAILTVDGVVGRHTQRAIWDLFANRAAPGVTPGEIGVIARELGVAPEQVRAVAAVESSGGGFLPSGHPKILWERHWLFRRLGRSLSASSVAGAFLAAPQMGGYTLDADKDGLNDSWEKLVEACAVDPVAAFESCSWGKFQIMGGHWKALGYPDVFTFAWAMRESEMGHYRALAAFIRANRLEGAMSKLGTTPSQNVPFALGYNGKAFRRNGYDVKLAKAMLEELAA